MTQEEITIDAGYAANLSRDDNDNFLTVSGVAIGEDEVTSHANGDKFWPAEQLMAATSSLIGVQLTKNHNHDKVEGVIGEVTNARYKEGVGILFEAKVQDESVANKIESGLLEVSVHAIHSNGGWTENGEMIAENIEFRDLSVVPRGAAASNEVKVGSMEPATLSAESISDMVGDEFESELADIEDLTQGTLVVWDDGSAHGEVVDTITEGQYDGEIDGDVVVNAPAALINVWNVVDGEWQASDTMVAHKPETLTIIDELPEVEAASLSEHDELSQVWSEFQDTVNMTAAQLRSWSENPCSREASQDPEAVIERNLRLLSRNKSEWTEGDIADAKRTISFVSRMSEQRPADPRDGPVEGCPSKWSISLLNWAYNPFESMPNMPSDMEPAEEITLDSHEDEEDMNESELSDIHSVEYIGTQEADWDAPNLEDFPPEYFDADGNAKFDLVDNHFLYSETQFPPENYTSLKFPVVSPSGMLNLSALRAAKSRAPQADIPVDEQEEIQSMADDLAAEAFGKEWGEESQSAEESDDGDSEESQSSLVENAESQDSDTMTEENTEDIDVEALQERVSTLEEQNESLESEVQSVRMEYAEALAGDGTFSAEELAEKFTVEELSEKYEDADAEIAEASAPDPQTGSVEEEEVEASEDDEQDEEIALLEAQIEQYEDMGWTGAKASAEAELSTLRDEDAE